jgi:hypothetical protein
VCVCVCVCMKVNDEITEVDGYGLTEMLDNSAGAVSDAEHEAQWLRGQHATLRHTLTYADVC